jgi:hypothetical protein
VTVVGVFTWIGSALTFAVWVCAAATALIYGFGSRGWWRTDVGRSFMTLIGSIALVLSFGVFQNLTRAIPVEWSPYTRTVTYAVVLGGLVMILRAMRRAQREGRTAIDAQLFELGELRARVEAIEKAAGKAHADER